MITPPKWYQKSEEWLEPAWPLMVGLAFVLIGVTIYFVVKQDRTALAAWLTYMYMP